MTNRDQLRENMAPSRDHTLTLRDQKLLEEYRLATAHLYCHGCGQHCEPAAGGVAVADILRYLRYDEVYGKRQRARELYQALSPEARTSPRADLAAAQAACPHGLPVVELLHRAESEDGLMTAPLRQRSACHICFVWKHDIVRRSFSSPASAATGGPGMAYLPSIQRPRSISRQRSRAERE